MYFAVFRTCSPRICKDANIQSLQKSKAARVLTKVICKKIERIFDDGTIVSLSQSY